MEGIYTPAVYLVGAGPGDAGLITLRGLALLEDADIVIYDRLANPQLLKSAKAGAELINVGKAAGHHSMKQEEINALLVEKGRSGKKIVRLKGGDPFVFGRGGEEALALRAAGIPFEVVPGVTSAVSVPAYAGIPVTHRGLSPTVTFITGHEAGVERIDWQRFSPGTDTLVFLMGLNNLPMIAEKLMAHGRSGETLTAVIENGTHNDERVVTAPLKAIAEAVKKAELKPPALIVVGETVSLREDLNWLEERPLFGHRVMITRDAAANRALALNLNEAGAEVLDVPLIQIKPLDFAENLKNALRAPLHWCVFTSVNGVELFFKELFKIGQDLRVFGGVKIAAIGTKTAEALRRHGLIADVVPEEFKAEALFAAMQPHLNPGEWILLPRAKEVRSTLTDLLEDAGQFCIKLPVYETLPADDRAKAFKAALPEADTLLFASASAAKVFAETLRETGMEACMTGETRPRLGCIGPVTAAALQKAGLPVDFTAKVYTLDGLIRAMIAFYAGTGNK